MGLDQHPTDDVFIKSLKINILKIHIVIPISAFFKMLILAVTGYVSGARTASSVAPAKQSEPERARKDHEKGHLNTPDVYVFRQTAAGAGAGIEFRKSNHHIIKSSHYHIINK
ncbi:hypothetical protein [Cyclobacterium salsum]|uniref:hypothetical protein n=1 Tax=Cyclobacterium salsum TaxID=2666329 RepID=UPI001391C853|nr:hypothetical protein [Cyclobacterium salsum]